MRPPVHMPLEAMIMSGPAMWLMALLSCTVRVSLRPGKLIGSSPCASRARVSSSKHSAWRAEISVALMARGLSTNTGMRGARLCSMMPLSV